MRSSLVLIKNVEVSHASESEPDNQPPVCIPTEYYNLAKVFSKTNTTKLLPHRSYDCSIELIANATPPKSQVYLLSQAEEFAMEEYIQEALASGLRQTFYFTSGRLFVFH